MKRTGLLLALMMVVVTLGAADTLAAGKTPQETLAKVAAAFKSGDAAAMTSCYKTNEQSARAMKAMVPVAKVMIDFSEKMEAAYGKEAANVFGGSGPRNMAENVAKATVKIDGDKAVATIPGERKPVNMVKENGVWLVVDKTMSEMTKEQVDMMLKQVVPMRVALESVMGEIGKEGVTQQDIMQKMTTAMQKAMAEAMKTPAPKPTPTPTPKPTPAPAPKPAPAAAPKPAPKPAASMAGAGKTPLETLKNLGAAYKAGDNAAVASCYAADAEGTRLLAVEGSLGKAQIAFGSKMQAAYGKQAAMRYSGGPKNILDNGPAAKIKIDGASAKATVSLEYQPGKYVKQTYTMARDKGVWVIVDKKFLMPTKARVDSSLRRTGWVIQAMKRVMPKIGEKGETPETIQVKLNAALETVRKEAAK